nr:condensation domain-containing protein [Bacillus pacificus]
TDDFKSKDNNWLNIFKDEPPLFELNTDFPRHPVQVYDTVYVPIMAGYDLTKRLKRIAKENGTTLYTVLLAALNVLFLKYPGQEDITIGTLTAGRSRPGLERIIGMFVNTVVIRNFPCRKKTFLNFLNEV